MESAIPSHCADLISTLAAAYATAWSGIAERMRERGRAGRAVVTLAEVARLDGRERAA